MKPLNPPSRWLVLLLAGLLGLAALPFPAQASPAPAAESSLSAAPTVLMAGMFDNVIGNRPRMIQAGFIAIAIGIVILMTSTRKH